ncbi:MAG TPA: HYR domain-containing protein, partial [Saprospiraceae bacterium]|nr:HYR domain-containing protein [Saprospiraceae bacterium]
IKGLWLYISPGTQWLDVRENTIYFTNGATEPYTTLFGKFDASGDISGACQLVDDVQVNYASSFIGQIPATSPVESRTKTLFAPSTPAPVVLDYKARFRCIQCESICDTIRVTKTISFYPGDTITIDGVAYTQSATVVQTFQTAAGCDSVVTTLLQLVITNLTLDCPPNLTVTLSPNQSSTAVDYSLPTGSTDCPDAALTLTLLQGPAIGDTFPEGTTLVCYQAANQCGIRDTCCFSVTAQEPSDPCDVQSPPGCLRFDLLDIRLDAQGQRRYRVRMTNTCTSSLQFAYIQLPNGVVAVAPKDAATYQAPSGNTYSVRNPNASPFYSMRFKPLSGTLSDGDAEVFEYTLPQQAQPAYIHVAARLLDGSYAQAHLSTYGCPVQPYAGMKPATAAQFFEGENSLHDMQVWPNPSSGTLTLDLRSWMGEHVNIQVLSLQGQALLQQAVPTESGQIFLHLPPTLPGGMYYLNVRGEASGERATARFVLER